MFFDTLMDNYITYLLVFARVFGIFIYNPIFSRKNIPSMVKIGTSGALALVIGMRVVRTVNVEIDSIPLLAVAFLKEGAIGLILGMLTQMFVSALFVSGELMDIQSGFGMAKIYDSSNGAQMSMFGAILNYLFILYFFITDSHLTYIKIFSLSYDFIPVGFTGFQPEALRTLVLYFGTVLTLAIKLALPLVVAQIILEVCVGILMKTVPQIQVMQVNIQVKMLFALFVVFLIANPMSDLLTKYMNIMIDNLANMLPLINV